MDTTTIDIHFSIEGEDFDPEIMTQKLGITPYLAWKKGNMNILSRKTFPNSFWEIHLGEEPSNDIENQLRKIFELLKDKKVILIKIRDEFRVEYTFALVIYIVDQQTPGMFLERWFLDFVNELKAEIDFDTYVISASDQRNE
jgi:hypothetical protein